MHDPCIPAALRVLVCAALVAAGAYGSLQASAAGLAGVLFVVLLRICWLEDNIKNDLIDCDRLPANYVNIARRRQRALWLLFGAAPGSDPAGWSPALVATGMRAQIQALAAALFGAVAVMAARDLPFHPAVNLAAASAVFLTALSRADALIATLALLDQDRPLPRHALLARVPWAYSSRERRDD